jgi:CHAT domain-containing protein
MNTESNQSMLVTPLDTLKFGKANWPTQLSNELSAVTELLQNDPAIQHLPDMTNGLGEQYKFMLDKWSANDYGAASRYAKRGRDIVDATVGENHPLCGLTIDIYIKANLVSSFNEAALKGMMERIRIDDQVLKELFAIGDEEEKMRLAESYWYRMSEFLSVIVQMPNFPNNNNDNQAALNLVLRRKALALEVSLAQRDAILIGRHPELKKRRDAWTLKKREVANKTLAGPKVELGPTGEQVHQQELARLKSECDRLEKELASQVPELNRELQHRLGNADCRSVAAALPAGSVLIEFVQFDFKSIDFKSTAEELSHKSKNYLAYILRAGDPDAIGIAHLGKAEPIDKLIAEFLAVIAQEGEHHARGETKRPLGNRGVNFESPETSQPPFRELSMVGNDLRMAVFDPLVAALGDYKQLFFAPDSELTRLPFAALPYSNDYLIAEYDIRYLSVGRDVLRFGPPRAQPAAPLVVAAPNFDLVADDAPQPADTTVPVDIQSPHLPDANLHFDYLKGIKKEGEAIAKRFSVPLHHGDEARVGWLKQVCHSPRILHLATHGFFLNSQQACDRKDPLLRAGLALAGANTGLRHQPLPADAGNGILNGMDVTELDLLDTELVVLSACDTGLGEERKGEGLFGFRRAFVLAGARTLVMSLWKVPDRETKYLMIHFYQELREGTSRAEALKKAQRKMKQIKKRYSHPFYWGAFICQGDPGPLSNPDGPQARASSCPSTA